MKAFVNQSGQTVCCPYSQEVDAIAEMATASTSAARSPTSSTSIRTTPRTATPRPPRPLRGRSSTPPPERPSQARRSQPTPNSMWVQVLYASPDGKRLYVGGECSDGQSHPKLVAFDPTTGHIDHSFNAPVPSGYVNAITQYGSRLYVAAGSARSAVWPTRVSPGSMPRRGTSVPVPCRRRGIPENSKPAPGSPSRSSIRRRTRPSGRTPRRRARPPTASAGAVVASPEAWDPRQATAPFGPPLRCSEVG